MREAPQYVFVNDQGFVSSSCHEPTQQELAFAAAGMVTIVRLADLHHYGSARRWMAVPVVSRAAPAGELVGVADL